MIADIYARQATDIDWTGVSRRYFNPGELETFVAMVEDIEARVVIEIGVNEGRNAQVLLSRDNHLQHYIGVEVPFTYQPALKLQTREVPRLPGRLAAHDPRFELIIKPRGAFDLSPEDLPQADVVFIDGDHGWRGVLNDTFLAKQVVRPGGLIVWHDYHDMGNVDVRDVLLALSSEMLIHHLAGTWFAIHRAPPSRLDVIGQLAQVPTTEKAA